MKTILTDEEITQVFDETNGASWRSYARAIEAKIIERIGEAVGYALYREGRQVGVERTLACANHWVEAEIVPLYAIPFIEAT